MVLHQHVPICEAGQANTPKSNLIPLTDMEDGIYVPDTHH